MLYLPWSLSPNLFDTLKPPHTLMSTMSTYFFSSPADSFYPTWSSLPVTYSKGIFHDGLTWIYAPLCVSLVPDLCHRSGSTRLARSSTPLAFNSASLGPNTWHNQSCDTMHGNFVVERWEFPLNNYNYHFDLHDDHRFLKCNTSDLRNIFVFLIFKNFLFYIGV